MVPTLLATEATSEADPWATLQSYCSKCRDKESEAASAASSPSLLQKCCEIIGPGFKIILPNVECFRGMMLVRKMEDQERKL